MGTKGHILCGGGFGTTPFKVSAGSQERPDLCLSPTGRGRRRPRRRVRVRRRPLDFEPRSFSDLADPSPSPSPMGRGFRKRIDPEAREMRE